MWPSRSSSLRVALSPVSWASFPTIAPIWIEGHPSALAASDPVQPSGRSSSGTRALWVLLGPAAGAGSGFAAAATALAGFGVAAAAAGAAAGTGLMAASRIVASAALVSFNSSPCAAIFHW